MPLELKRKNGGANITAYDDAIEIYHILGDGILDKAYTGFQITYNSSKNSIHISSGIFVFGGRRIVVEENTALEIDMSSFTSQVAYVVCEMTLAEDDTQSTVSIYATHQSVTNSSNPTTVGVHKIVLAKLQDQVITLLVPRLSPGVAKNAMNLLSTGTIGNAKFSDIFLGDMSGVRYARRANVAAEAEGFVGGTINKVDSNLFMPNRGVYLLQRCELINNTDTISVDSKKEVILPLSEKITQLKLDQGRVIMVVACEKNQSISYPKESSTDSLLGGKISDLPYKGLKMSLQTNNKTVKIFNPTDNLIALNGLKLNAYIYG